MMGAGKLVLQKLRRVWQAAAAGRGTAPGRVPRLTNRRGRGAGSCLGCLVAAMALTVLSGGCPSPESEQPPERLEPTAEERRLLRLEGIEDPYGEPGQQRIRKLRRNREELEELYEQREQLLPEREEERPSPIRPLE